MPEGSRIPMLTDTSVRTFKTPEKPKTFRQKRSVPPNQLAEGIDPSVVRVPECSTQENTFELVEREYLNFQLGTRGSDTNVSANDKQKPLRRNGSKSRERVALPRFQSLKTPLSGSRASRVHKRNRPPSSTVLEHPGLQPFHRFLARCILD